MGADRREVNGVLIVHPTDSRLTAMSGAGELREALMGAVRRGHLALAVDLAGVEYADSTMIGDLIAAFKDLHRDGGLICLFNVAPELREFLHQTVLDRLIEICTDERAALLLMEDRPKSKRRGLRRLFS